MRVKTWMFHSCELFVYTLHQSVFVTGVACVGYTNWASQALWQRLIGDNRDFKIQQREGRENVP